MILYYAIGGGLGHVTRARAVLHSLQCQTPAVILSSSPFVSDFRTTEGVRVQVVPVSFARDVEGYRAWLTRLLAELQPHALYLDTFPAGIVGEFCDFPEIDNSLAVYVARRLKWSAYAQQLRGRAPTFQRTFCLEPLEEAHEQFVRTHSPAVVPFFPVDPPDQLSVTERTVLGKFSDLEEPFWLVVHCGKSEEVVELVSYAEEMRQCERSRARLVIAAPELHVPPLAHLQTLGLFPARTLFPLAERVVSACGFNVMRQMSPFRRKHFYLPFARRFDDQYWRAMYWRGQQSVGESIQHSL